MSTIDRSNPGDLSAGTGLTFRTNLNADRDIVYAHAESLEAMVELLAAQYCGKGTIPTNTTELTIDSPVAGRVYCPTGYMAIVGGVPVITTESISQAYNAAITDHVFLVVGTDGALTLRCNAATTENANDLWIADVVTGLSVTQNPTGKLFARIDAKMLDTAITTIIGSAPTITVGTEGSNIINVAVQLKDADGVNLAYKAAVEAWLSDTAAGDTSETEPDGGVGIGTNGVILYAAHTSVNYNRIISSATGVFDINITHAAGAATWYLNVEYQGRIYSSAAITFA